MPNSFPLILPAAFPTSRVKFAMINQVATSRSPFSGVRQTQEWPGQWWEVDVTLAPMKRSVAAPIIAVLSACQGQAGTVLYGDPNGKTPQGLASRMSVNLLKWSEAFDNAVWTNSGNAVTVTANNQTDPNGNLLADTLAFTPDATHESYRSQDSGVVPSNGQQYTFSVWLKAASPVSANMRVLQSTGQNDTATPQSVTTSWQRFSITVTMASVGSGSLLARIGQSPNVTPVTVFAWGAQLELASAASAYIGSTSGSVVMNGAVQGPKFILLRGFPPNTLVLNAGDWLSPGAGVSATRISTSGGSTAFKYFWQTGTSINGQVYIISVRIKNLGAKTVQVANYAQTKFVNVTTGQDVIVTLTQTGDGVNPVQLTFWAPTAGDNIDFIAWAPRIQKQGIDENLIPLANQNFTGWTAGTGATITLVQSYNQRLYQAQSDVTSDSNGNAGVEIFPRWRSGDAVADGDPVTLNSAKGVFFLADNRREWDLDNAMNYGLSMKLIEAF